MQTFTLHVTGTHCSACKILIEDILNEQPTIKEVHVDLNKKIVTVRGEFTRSPEVLAKEWSTLLAEHNYSLSTEKQTEKKDYKSAIYALPLGLAILAGFILLQKSGIINLSFEGGLSPITTLLIGVIASLSSCLAVVGGLILSLSANMSTDIKTTRPISLFHIGRLAGFAILGGTLGSLGNVIAINQTITGTFGVLVSLIMIILGINLLDLFHGAKKFQLALPRSIYTKITSIEKGLFAPLIIGLGTFFLPCGFTQSMQLAALSSGSFLKGAEIMFTFALGTLPMLAIISFGSFRFAQTRYASLFFKTAGIVVIGLGLFALLSGLAGLGIIKPLINL